MVQVVYTLCAITSAVCATLLFRGYARTGARLLLWSGLCFVGFTLNNMALFGDKVIWPEVDLQLLRALPALVGLVLLIFGLIWESK